MSAYVIFIREGTVDQRTRCLRKGDATPYSGPQSMRIVQNDLAQHSFDPPVGPPGDRRLLSPHNRPVSTADGWIAFTINSDQQVRAFLTVVGRANDDLPWVSLFAHQTRRHPIPGQLLTRSPSCLLTARRISAEPESSTSRIARDRASPPTIAANMKTARSCPCSAPTASRLSPASATKRSTPPRKAVCNSSGWRGISDTSAAAGQPCSGWSRCSVDRYCFRNCGADKPVNSRRHCANAHFIASVVSASFDPKWLYRAP
jgi:hypothetical protein